MPIEHHIADGVEGPAYVIVPISENAVNRAVFNAVARHRLDGPCESTEEITTVWSAMHGRHRDAIHEALGSYGEVDPTDDSQLEALEDHVYEHL